MMTNKQLKEIILELRLKLIKASIPKGHCPYAYYNQFENPLGNCDDCSNCKETFLNKWREIISEELKTL